MRHDLSSIPTHLMVAEILARCQESNFLEVAGHATLLQLIEAGELAAAQAAGFTYTTGV